LKESYSYGFLSLWIVFISYYGDVFNKLKELPYLFLAILGGFGGSLAYWSAYKLGALSISQDSHTFYLLYIFALWAIFFPISMWLFYEDKYWNYILDKSVVFSFDKTGYLRHKAKFKEDLSQKTLANKISLVTGGTSGIGGEVSKELSSLGSKVFVTGRNKQKGNYFEKTNLNVSFHALDMANWTDLDDFCKNSDCYDYIVLNAGGMPEKLVLNDFDLEHQCASQLLGHYFLIYLLSEYGKINKNARIIWVSSGGMYLKKLDVDSLFLNQEYDKVATYANVKRAQITLVEEICKQDRWKNFQIITMHPGWVATTGLKDSLPGLFSMMKNRLRDLEEGADTIIWLLLTKVNLKSGGFYFDRKITSPYLSNSFNPSREQRKILLEKIENYRGEHL
jgi:dehydrogenase/reductase SDR family protein 12